MTVLEPGAAHFLKTNLITDCVFTETSRQCFDSGMADAWSQIEGPAPEAADEMQATAPHQLNCVSIPGNSAL